MQKLLFKESEFVIPPLVTLIFTFAVLFMMYWGDYEEDYLYLIGVIMLQALFLKTEYEIDLDNMKYGNFYKFLGLRINRRYIPIQPLDFVYLKPKVYHKDRFTAQTNPKNVEAHQLFAKWEIGVFNKTQGEFHIQEIRERGDAKRIADILVNKLDVAFREIK